VLLDFKRTNPKSSKKGWSALYGPFFNVMYPLTFFQALNYQFENGLGLDAPLAGGCIVDKK
jgi:hypothetical protein